MRKNPVNITMLLLVLGLLAVTASCSDSKSKLEEGRQKAAAKEYASAIQLFSEYIDANNEDPEGFYERAHASHFAGDRKGALADLDQALQLKADGKEFRLLRSVLLSMSGQHASAKKELDLMLAQSGDDARAYYFRGRTKFKMNDHRGAIEDYTAAIALEPDNQLYYHWRGRAYTELSEKKLSLKDFSKALEILDAKIKQNSDSALLYYYRGNYKVVLYNADPDKKTEKLKGSFLADFEIGKNLEGEDALAHYLKADALFRLEMYDDARKCYQKAIDLELVFEEDMVNVASAYFGLANCAFCQEELEEAITLYTRVIAMEGAETSLAYSNRAYCKYKMDDPDGACEDYQKAWALGDPDASQHMKMVGCNKKLSAR